MPDNRDAADAAVREVAARLGDGWTVDRADWYDIRHTSTDSKAEVKSTVKEVASGRPGRFILRGSQHDSLVAADRRGTAWYVFFLRDAGRMVKREPATVSDVIESWGESSHRQYDRETRVPWFRVM
jgi:hypothetical protein